jgi:CheY-like chemotaxis protein
LGTGLGLTTVAGIAHNHGGFVQVTSSPGQGTTFKVYLPASGKGVHGQPAGGTPPTRFDGHGEGVLVADDDESVRAILKSLLERLHFRVFLAADGTEALGTFAAHRDHIRLAVTDARMPYLEGTALVRALRHMAPELGIIAMSGLHDEARNREFTACGVSHFLHKPFTMLDLSSALQACLGPADQAELKLGA